MKICQQNEKDISKVFTFVRAQLQAKEKELLELQRADPCLLAPGSEQIDVLLDAIASLQLSIEDEDESFVFASIFDWNDTPSDTSVCSAGFNSIKTLPLAIWLPQSAPVKQQHEEPPSIFNHLLSLPSDAYLASSWPSSCETTATTQNQLFRRNSMFSHLLCMPIDSFKSSSNTYTSIEINNNKYFSLAQQHEERPSIFNHLLSLPSDAYLASSLPSSCETTATTQNQSFCRNSMFSHLLCMPIDSFKSSSNACASIEINNNKNSQNNVLPTTEGVMKSVLNTGMDFSKEFWLRNSQNAACNYEISCYA